MAWPPRGNEPEQRPANWPPVLHGYLALHKSRIHPRHAYAIRERCLWRAYRHYPGFWLDPTLGFIDAWRKSRVLHALVKQYVVDRSPIRTA